jgi:chromosome partitioning protein
MKSVAVVARKGGAGKTTLAIHMAVLAHHQGKRVLLLDLDPQRSLSVWWHSRQADTPALVETDARRLPALLQEAAGAGYDLAVIDTPPAITFDTARVVAAADLVLIPLRPSLLDLMAVSGTADVVASTKTPGLLVLNACPPPQGSVEAPTTRDARKALAASPVPLATVSVAQRMDYSRALNSGEAVNEAAPTSKAAAEILRLWLEVERKLTT